MNEGGWEWKIRKGKKVSWFIKYIKVKQKGKEMQENAGVMDRENQEKVVEKRKVK